MFMFQYIMNLTQHKVKVMNIGLTKSAIILAESFVDFKRKAASQLCLSGWLEVQVYKAEDFEVSRELYICNEVSSLCCMEDVTNDMMSRGAGTVVTVESFPYIDFSSSVLVVKITKRAHSFSGRNVQVVHQGHDHVDNVNIHES